MRLRPEWSADWWRDSHPLGIEKLAGIGTATGDLAKATKFYKGVRLAVSGPARNP